jgi:hypothetical protein
VAGRPGRGLMDRWRNGEVRLYDLSTVLPTGHKSKKCLQVEGLPVALSKRHAKIRRDGYRA